MSEPAAAEVHALARVVDELNYYDLLEVSRDATAPDVRKGYHRVRRRFHPDASRNLDESYRLDVERIAKRVTEAYSVLRDPRRRKVYDERLAAEGDTVRIQLVEAEKQAERADAAERGGTTPNGRRFFGMAQKDHRAGKLDAAIRNLQMAVTYEPDNEHFRQVLGTWKAERA